jgi:hypothetical protein
MSDQKLDEILDLLDRHHPRAAKAPSVQSSIALRPS